MAKILIVASSISCRWQFDNVLTNLPAPGSPSFEQLWKKLEPHGISADGYSLETPTTRLSDVLIKIGLSRGRILASVSYEWFELRAEPLWKGFEFDLIAISNEILSILKKAANRILVTARAHSQLKGVGPESYLAGHLKASGNSSGTEFGPLIADGFAYNLVGHNSQVYRVAVSKSLVYPNALFLELYCEYVPPSEPQAIAARFSEDSQRILNLIDLDIMGNGEGEENA